MKSDLRKLASAERPYLRRKGALCTVLLALALLLCACGGSSGAPAATPAPSAEPSSSVAEATPAPVATLPGDSLKAASEDKPETEEAEPAQLATAKGFVDKTLAELTAEIGEPLSSAYVPSCLGPGEDGELVYEGFKVYTYNNGETETVLDVIAD